MKESTSIRSLKIIIWKWRHPMPPTGGFFIQIWTQDSLEQSERKIRRFVSLNDYYENIL